MVPHKANAAAGPATRMKQRTSAAQQTGSLRAAEQGAQGKQSVKAVRRDIGLGRKRMLMMSPSKSMCRCTTVGPVRHRNSSGRPRLQGPAEESCSGMRAQTRRLRLTLLASCHVAGKASFRTTWLCGAYACACKWGAEGPRGSQNAQKAIAGGSPASSSRDGMLDGGQEQWS